MNDNFQELNKILSELRDNFLIIGLTGAIGSGCSETAKFLSTSREDMNFKNILNCMMKKKKYLIEEYDDLEPYRVKKLMWFYNSFEWIQFKIIKVSNILFSFFLQDLVDKLNLKENNFKNFIKKLKKSELSNKEQILAIFELEKLMQIENFKIEELFLNKEIKNYKDRKTIISNKLKKIEEFIKNYVKKNKEFFRLFQDIGNDIRNGKLMNLNEEIGLNVKSSKFVIPEIIRRIIKILNKNENESFFVIDALRDVFEIEYFKHRYSSFYVFSILANEDHRRERIIKDFGLGIKEYEEIKNFETKIQKINDCIGRGDIFVNNDFNSPYKEMLYYQLLKYVALIRKPGLFTPTKDERFMQVALTARYNSGCISRQVGAVVIGEDGYIRGFGWNDVPENRIPCVYRTVDELLSCNDEIMFSEYERSEEFIDFVKKEYKSYNFLKQLPFCFKDLQNKKELLQKKENIKDVECKKIDEIIEILKCKNPTRERALHAEENAFLQIAKIGGMSVKNGTLYTTDSPCQLCAKKLVQLKIKRVVYIDAYPDISIAHTLKSGPKEEQPKFEMFRGVSREAYFKLYTPIIGRKDEIEFLKKGKK